MSEKRFAQPDPIGFAADPTNLYRYCGNDPVNKFDPLGLASSSEESGLRQKRKETAGEAAYKAFASRMWSLGGGDWIGNSRGLGDNDVRALQESHRTADNLPMAVNFTMALTIQGDGRAGDPPLRTRNVMSHSNGVIYINTDPRVRIAPNEIPGRLAHEGYHFVYRGHSYHHERNAYDVQHGFGNLTGWPHKRPTREEVEDSL